MKRLLVVALLRVIVIGVATDSTTTTVAGLVLVQQSAQSQSQVQQVAVIGTTGNIGRAAIAQLSIANIRTRCLLRHDISNSNESPSAKIAASLASLNGVTMVKGDVTNKESIANLIEGCDAILCLQGPPMPNPILSILPFLSFVNSKASSSSSSHPYMINYVGMQNVIQAVKEQQEKQQDDNSTVRVKRIVRLTGKGEQPFSFFTILINMLGFMAKAWNYEGEQLLRKSGIDYTIIRPGLLQSSDKYASPPKSKMIKDNGGDLRVSPVTYDQIANVCVDSLGYDNCAKTTLTVMNVEEGEGYNDYSEILPLVKMDELENGRYPESLLEKHRMGARIGFVALCLFVFGVVNAIKGIVGFFL